VNLRLDRSDLWLAIAALAGGAIFFGSLAHLWPLAATDVNAPPARAIATATTFLKTRGIAADRYASAARLEHDSEILDYLLRAFGRDTTQRLIAAGEPVFDYAAYFKKGGDPDALWADIHPATGIVGWGRTVQEDAPGATIDAAAARRAVMPAVTAALRGNAAGLEETGYAQRERPARRDHSFVFERWLSRNPELRERVTATVSGDEVTAVHRQLVVPEKARRAARTREAPTVALQTGGFLLVGLAGLAALVVFLTSLARGEVRLGTAARWVAIIVAFFLMAQLLRPVDLLLRWDALWPRWIANFQTLALDLAQGAWIAFALFIVIAAGDALDRRSGANRGVALWSAGRGRLLDPAVGIASLRGFMVGLVCGGAMALTLLALERFAGGWMAIQPQGFFFFAINSICPAASTLLYFLMVALVEELGYRFFAGTWLLSRTGSRWLAILVPAALYGTSHTGLTFLPPAEPFWGRAVALTVVGCVWGWAFLRYDALTVVLSHFTADLFIFNWPRLGSGDPILIAKAIATIAVPLLPGLIFLARYSSRRVEVSSQRQ
jgi:Type II CAAX prenyl endopeptidase Rce1-like